MKRFHKNKIKLPLNFKKNILILPIIVNHELVNGSGKFQAYIQSNAALQ